MQLGTIETIKNPEHELQKVQKTIAELEATPADEVAKNLTDGIYDWDRTLFAIRRLVNSSYRFKPDELQKLGRKQPFEHEIGDMPLAFELIKHGYIFTIDEILKMKNHKDLMNRTVAHMMAMYGYDFSVNDLLRLGNKKTDEGDTVAHYMARFQGKEFTSLELLKLRCPIIGIFKNTVNKNADIYRKYFDESRNHPRAKYRCTYTQTGNPVFEKTGLNDGVMQGSMLGIGFYSINFLPNYHDYSITENYFWIELIKSDNFMIPTLSISVKNDLFNFPYQKMTFLKLVVNLNEAIKNNQEFNVSDYLNSFKYSCEISLSD